MFPHQYSCSAAADCTGLYGHVQLFIVQHVHVDLKVFPSSVHVAIMQQCVAI